LFKYVLGIVHPKVKILSSFTHPPAVPNLYTFPSHVEQKRRYFEEPNSCLSPLTSISIEVNGDHQLFDYSIIQNILFSVQQTVKKETHTGL